LNPGVSVPVHTRTEKFEKATTGGHFGLLSEENWHREITWLWSRQSFQKAPFSKCFLPHEYAKPAFSNSSGLKSVF